MSEALVNVKGMGLMRITQQSQPQATAGIQSRVNKQNAFDDRVQGVLSGIGNQIADVALNDEGGLNNPEQLKAALDNKYREVRAFGDAITEGMTPMQKAAVLTIPFGVLGDAAGIGADIEMYFKDPESRTWANAALSTVGVAGGAASISPSVAAILPIVKRNAQNISRSENLTESTVESRRVGREALGVARARERMPNGQYVGAPEGIDTPEKLEGIIQNYMDRVQEGVGGKYWYEDTSEWINHVSPQGTITREQVAELGARTSAGAKVDHNVGFLTKGVNQNAAGLDTNTGRFPNGATKSGDIFSETGPDRKGLKLGEFAENLTTDWRDGSGNAVHDIWDGRAWGYVKKNGKPWDGGFSSTQHSFMDEVAEEVTSRLNASGALGTDWNPMRIQAAAWTGEKIRHGDIVAEDAAMHFGSYSPKYAANATYEQTPGVGTGQLDEMANQSMDIREDFSRSPESSWTDDRGRDRIYDSAGMLTEPTNDTIGAFRAEGGNLETNPANTARPLVQTGSSGPMRGKVLDADRQLLDTAESGRAYIDVQNAGAWHRVVPLGQTNIGDRTSLSIDIGRAATEDEMSSLANFAADNGFYVSDSGSGVVNLIHDTYSDAFGARKGSKLKKELASTLGDDLRAIVGESDVVPYKIESEYLDYEPLWKEQGSGKATTKFLDDMDALPTMRDNIEPELIRKAESNMLRDSEWAERTGMPIREDIQRARQILMDGGLKALRQALDSGVVLPAAAGMIVAPGLLQSDQQTMPGLAGS